MKGTATMETIDVVDIKSLRKKFLKKKIFIDWFKTGVMADYNPKTKEVFLEFTHLASPLVFVKQPRVQVYSLLRR